MKQIVILVTGMLLNQLAGFAQFPLYVFPMGVIGDTYADTLLNTRAILLKAGVKKIFASQTLPEVTKTFASKTIYLNGKGNIDAAKSCFRKNTTNDFTHCIDDTFLYDSKGRMVEIVMSDNRGNLYPRLTTEYVSEREIRSVSAGGFNPDTSISIKYLNEKGQMVRLIQITKGADTAYSSFYYNDDGLFDSIKYENSAWETFIFNRQKKKKSKIIKMENPSVKYKWIYNQSGQCITTKFTVKSLPNVIHGDGRKGPSKTELRYFYNSDGTLSRVTHKSRGTPAITMYYTYTK